MDKLVNVGKITGLCYDPTLTYEDPYKLLYSTTATPQIVSLLKEIMAAPVVTKSTALCGTQNPNYPAHKSSHWPRPRADESNPRLRTLEQYKQNPYCGEGTEKHDGDSNRRIVY